MQILYNNWVSSATTITPLTEDPNYLFEDAWQDTRLTRYARTVDDDDQTFIIDLGAARAVDYCAILGHNFTSGATIKIQGNASDVWTAPSVDITLTYTANNIYYAFSSTQTYRYWRLTVDDASNPDTYLQISKLWLSSYLQLPYMAKSQKIPTASTSTAQESISGQSYGDKKLIYRYGNITFPYVTDADKIKIDALFNVVDKTDPIMTVIWEDDLTEYPPIYSRLTSDLEWQRVDNVGRIWSVQISFKEIF
jgi:hypothetical protein